MERAETKQPEWGFWLQRILGRFFRLDPSNSSPPMSSQPSAAHMEARRAATLTTTFTDLSSLMTTPLRQLNVRKLDQMLFDTFPHVSQNNLRLFRRQHQALHADGTVIDWLTRAHEEPFPKKRKTTKASRGASQKATSGASRGTAESASTGDAQASTPSITTFSQLWREKQTYLQDLQNLTPGDCACCVCFDSFADFEAVVCPKQTACHWVCRRCFYQYMESNCQNLQLDQIPCPACQSLYTSRMVREHLPALMVREMEQRAENLNLKVLLGAGVVAQLFCQCGFVAVVMETDIGDGTLLCQGCNTRYCCRCGNPVHAGTTCPAPKETLVWCQTHAKLCPGCGDAVQKHGGCNHYTHSRSVGGCGHEFCWLCLTPWNGHTYAICQTAKQALNKSRT